MLYLHDAAYLDCETLALTRGHLAVEEGPRGGISLNAAIPRADRLAPGDRVLYCGGRFVTRALACGHHHIYSALARGMPPAPVTPKNFTEQLKYVWWRLDKCLDQDMIAASALAAGLHMLKNGVTFCIDHHASPHAVPGSLKTISRAFDSLGLGSLLCYEISCRDGEDIAHQGLEEHDAYLGSGGKGHVGLHASFTVSDEVLHKAVALARRHDTGVHIHVAEAASDQRHCLDVHGKTVTQRLMDAGALESPRAILAHCIHISPEDKKILAASPCWIAQNTESNQNNNVGLGDYGYTDRVMLGVDGMHSDMIRAAQSAYLAGIAAEGLTCAGAYARLRAAHRHIALHDAPGDGPNNLIILDYDAPTPMDQDNALGHFFYGWDSRHVHTVIAQGKPVVEDRRFLGDEEGILAFAAEQARRLWARLL